MASVVRNTLVGVCKNLIKTNTNLVQCSRTLCTTNQPALNRKEIEVTFIRANGERLKAKGNIGDSLLDVVKNNNLDIDGYGACEGTITCSTCHVIMKKEDYEAVPDQPTAEESDMLDLAYELSDTSRLGCQVCLSEKLDGLEVTLPSSINDARES